MLATECLHIGFFTMKALSVEHVMTLNLSETIDLREMEEVIQVYNLYFFLVPSSTFKVPSYVIFLQNAKRWIISHRKNS